MTQILEAVAAGDENAAEGLLPLVYDELRRVWHARSRRPIRTMLARLTRR